MGKHFNSQQYREFERKQNKAADESMGDGEPELTEFERASQWDSQYWDRLDAEARGQRIGVGR